MDTLPLEMIAYLSEFLDQISKVLVRLVCVEWAQRFPAITVSEYSLPQILGRHQYLEFIERMWDRFNVTDWYIIAIEEKAGGLRQWLYPRARPEFSARNYAKRCIRERDVEGLKFHLEGVNMLSQLKLKMLRFSLYYRDPEIVETLCTIFRYGGDTLIEKIFTSGFYRSKYMRYDLLLALILENWDSCPNAYAFADVIFQDYQGVDIIPERVTPGALAYLKSKGLDGELKNELQKN